MMKILIVGMYYSGSSAVLEWLKDFNTIEYKNDEFDIYRRPGKISDLLSQSDPEIKLNIVRHIYRDQIRTISRRKFIEDKTLILLKNRVKELINILFDKQYIKKSLSSWPFDNSRYANEITKKYLKDFINANIMSKGEEIDFWRNWLDSLLEPSDGRKTHILLDQPVYLSQSIEQWHSLFSPYKMLLIHRNPVDQYADLIKNNILHLRNGYTVDSHSSKNYYNPDNTAKSFTQMLKERYFYVDEYIDAYPDNIMPIAFEAFVNDHVETISTICEYLGVNQHDSGATFDITPSMENVGIGKAYLNAGVISKSQYDELESINHIRDRL
jgi:hypothetical protein